MKIFFETFVLLRKSELYILKLRELVQCYIWNSNFEVKNHSKKGAFRVQYFKVKNKDLNSIILGTFEARIFGIKKGCICTSSFLDFHNGQFPLRMSLLSFLFRISIQIYDVTLTCTRIFLLRMSLKNELVQFFNSFSQMLIDSQ